MGKSLSSCSCKSLALSVMVALQVTIFASLFGRSACVLQRADEDSKIIVQSSPLNADSVLHRSTLVEQSLPLFGTAVLTTLHAPRSGARSPLLQPQSSPLNADSILHHSTLVEQSLPLLLQSSTLASAGSVLWLPPRWLRIALHLALP